MLVFKHSYNYIIVMKSMLTLIVFLSLSSFLAAPAWAGERVTFTEALIATLRERPMVQASAADVEAAAAEAKVRDSRYLPRLTFSERFVRTDEPGGSLFIDLNQGRFELTQDANDYNDPPARSDFETRLTLTQPIYNPDLKYDRERARLNRDAAMALHDRHREEAVLATLQAYLSVQQGHTRLAWAEQSLEEAEELTAMAREREKSGTGLHADTLRSEVLQNDVRRKLLVASNALQTAKRRLALMIGRGDGEIDIAGPLSADRLQLPDPGASLERGDLVALDKTAAGAELSARQEKAAYLPRIGMQASYIRHEKDLSFDDDADSWSISAGLEWLLFDGGERSGALSGASARQRALKLQKREQARQARFAVFESVQKSEEAILQLELTRGSLAAAEASRELVYHRYSAGLVALSELLAVQTELARVRSELATAETSLLSARANVYYAQGTLLQALLPESEAKP